MKKLILNIITLMFLVEQDCYADVLHQPPLFSVDSVKEKKHISLEENTPLVWKGDALFVPLPLAQEKRLIFPARVTVDIKSALTTDQLRIINDNKSIYLTALKDFSKTRLYITLQESGDVILVDILTEKNASSASQHINIKQQPEDSTIGSAIDDGSSFLSEAISDVDLMRFAWTQLYAPERLLNDVPDYPRAAMHTQEFVADLIYGDKVIAHPDSAWKAGDYYVTAVSIQNKYPHITHLDIQQDLCGYWKTAMLYPLDILAPHGDREADSTTLFLISDKPFGEALGVCHGDA